MYELKQRAIKEKVYPKRFPIPVLAQEFTKMVHDYGRITETWLVTQDVPAHQPAGRHGHGGPGPGFDEDRALFAEAGQDRAPRGTRARSWRPWTNENEKGSRP